MADVLPLSWLLACIVYLFRSCVSLSQRSNFRWRSFFITARCLRKSALASEDEVVFATIVAEAGWEEWWLEVPAKKGKHFPALIYYCISKATGILVDDAQWIPPRREKIAKNCLRKKEIFQSFLPVFWCSGKRKNNQLWWWWEKKRKLKKASSGKSFETPERLQGKSLKNFTSAKKWGNQESSDIS